MKYCRDVRIRRVLLSLALACPLAMGGCSFSPNKPQSLWPNSFFSQEEATIELPDRVTPFWTDTVLYQPKQPGIRGFGGRVYFYQDGQEEPVEVDGNLIVYAFDNEAEPSEAGKPVKKFVFTADQFATHMSRTNIGASYSIWLPWDEVGGPTKQLSLVTRFEGRDGGVVISEPTVKLLPGVNAEFGKANTTKVAADGAIQPASFISGQVSTSVRSNTGQYSPDPTEQNNAAPAMTLDLPPSFQRHLRNRETLNSNSANRNFTAPAQNPTPLNEQPSANSQTSSQPGSSNQQLHESREAINETSAGNHNLRDTFRKPANPSESQKHSNSRPAHWLLPPR